MKKIYINNDWLFSESFKEEYLTGAIDSDFVQARVPHTVKELPYNCFSEDDYQMVSAYRRVISAPLDWTKKRIFITFEGAAHVAEVYLNGEKIGEHKSGYTAFTLELTQNLVLGEDNILIVKLDSRENANVPPFGNVIDYMTFGGLYRDVYLDVKEELYISDVFAKPEFTGKLVCDIALEGDIPSDTVIKQSLTYLNDGRENTIFLKEQDVVVNAFSINSYVENVKLWDLNKPNRYYLETELYIDGELVDVHFVTIGFRHAEFTNDGFYLNGRRIQIRGLNRHQSYPYVGYAMPESMQRHDAQLLKELGVNAVRTSHYPQSQYFIDECDRLGLLVFTEIPGWQHIGNEEWKDVAVENVREMIVQYRNHPSIVIWGVRINESRDDHDFYTRTNALAHQLDPTRQTGGVRCIKNSELLEDVYTYNDFHHDGSRPGCEPKAAVTSDNKKPYIVTEYCGHMFPTKSFDDEEHRLEHALRHARVLDSVASHPEICGSFGWCFFDYNTHKDFGSGDRICYHGVTDMFRNKKLASAVYMAQSEGDAMLEISSSMEIGEHPACVRGKVWAFTNADSVKMYKNDRFIKEYTPKSREFSHLASSPILIDDYIGDILIENEKFSKRKARCVADALNYIGLNGYTNYTPGFILRALKCVVGHGMSVSQITDLYTKYIGDWGGSSRNYRFDAIKNGEVVKIVIRSPMNSMTLEAKPSATVLREGRSYDVCLVSLRALDENGNVLNYANEPISISVDGPITLIGPSLTALRGGMGGFYLKSIGKKGIAKIRISSPNLNDITFNIEIK